MGNSENVKQNKPNEYLIDQITCFVDDLKMISKRYEEGKYDLQTVMREFNSLGDDLKSESRKDYLYE